LGDVKYGCVRAFKDRSIALHSIYLSLKHPTKISEDKIEKGGEEKGKLHWKKQVHEKEGESDRLGVVAPLPGWWSKRMGQDVVDAVGDTTITLLQFGIKSDVT